MKAWYEESIGFKLARAARVHRTQVGEAMRELGIHPGQEALLQALMTNDGVTMGALAETIGVRPPTLTKMVIRMTVEGLIYRQGDDGDARRALVFLTDEGRSRAGELKKRWRKIEKKLLDGLSDKDVKRLGTLLTGLTEQMLEAEAKPPKAKAAGKSAKAKTATSKAG